MERAKQQIDIKDHVLEEIICGKCCMSFEFMAANILVKHVQHLYMNEPSEDNLHIYCSRLKRLLIQNADIPSVKNDLAKISSLES